MTKLNFVAEVGVNHEGVLESAEEHIWAAAAAGATAVKFQAYKADRIASKVSPSYWDTSKESETSQFNLFSKYDKFELSDYKKLARVCKDAGVDFMVTCFDFEWLESLDPLVNVHKIASADLTNTRLVRAVGSKGKKVLLSTGASTAIEVDRALDELISVGARDVVLMHCVLCYPTRIENSSLGRMESLKEIAYKFGLKEIGYSDHTEPTPNFEVLVSAMALGATWIEKHFSMTPDALGNDHYHSFGPENLTEFMKLANRVSLALAYNEDSFISIQAPARTNARRGLYAKTDISCGSIIEEDQLIELRPVTGVPSEKVSEIVGKRVNRLIQKGEAVTYESLE